MGELGQGCLEEMLVWVTASLECSAVTDALSKQGALMKEAEAQPFEERVQGGCKDYVVNACTDVAGAFSHALSFPSLAFLFPSAPSLFVLFHASPFPSTLFPSSPFLAALSHAFPFLSVLSRAFLFLLILSPFLLPFLPHEQFELFPPHERFELDALPQASFFHEDQKDSAVLQASYCKDVRRTVMPTESKEQHEGWNVAYFVAEGLNIKLRGMIRQLD